VTEERENAKAKGGGFFHIDRRTWDALSAYGDVGLQSAYLAVATGTGAGNCASKWSAKAVEKFTGMHHLRAKIAITALIQKGFLKHGEKSTPQRPKYELEPFEVVLENRMQEIAPEGSYQRSVWNQARDAQGTRTSAAQEKRYADLIRAGLVWPWGESHSVRPPEQEDVWLPNTLVMGTSSGEASPVRRLRAAGDTRALWLLVNLYAAHELGADGGILRTVVRQEFTAKKYGERGRHIVWGFKGGQSSFYHGKTSTAALIGLSKVGGEAPIWKAMYTLSTMGLVTCVPHLVENDNLSCEPLHGFGWEGKGEEAECLLGEAADAAARRIIGEQREWTAENDGVTMLAPVSNSNPNVQMVGIYRLTYRPHTRRTAEWIQRMSEQAAEWMEIYEQMGQSKVAAFPHQGRAG
jgi:hypothetical protein